MATNNCNGEVAVGCDEPQSSSSSHGAMPPPPPPTTTTTNNNTNNYARYVSHHSSDILVDDNNNEDEQHQPQFPCLTVDEFKSHLIQTRQHGIVLDIDETLSATNVKWFERAIALFGLATEDSDLSVEQLIEKYHLAQYNPAWNTNPDALVWMAAQRASPEAQDDLPLVEGAADGVRALLCDDKIKIVGYLTVRPTNVCENTARWLREMGFPPRPVIHKPLDVAFEKGNEWKGSHALHTLWPHVTGIVDDNPKVAIHVGSQYQGRVYLFSKTSTQPHYEWALPCPTWPDVVRTVKTHPPPQIPPPATVVVDDKERQY